MIRGYALLLEMIHGLATAPILPFDGGAIALFDQLRSQQVRVSTMDLRIATVAIQVALDIKGGYSPGISKR